MRRAILTTVMTVAAATATFAQPLETRRDVGRALASCWSAPAGFGGSKVTLRFAFNRDGGIIGEPRATFSDVAGDAERKRRFVAAAAEALTACTPLTFSERLGSAIAGKIFVLSLSAR